MSLAQVLDQLPEFSVAERQLLILRALELDDPAFPEQDDILIATRLEEHQRNPSSSISLEEMKSTLLAEFGG